MNTDKSMGAVVRADDQADSRDHLPQSLPGNEISLMAEPRALVPQQLEERRLIHRDASSRVQSDTFRELRTHLLGLANGGNFTTLVVAVSPRCGGSFVARNLAAAFALDESKTSLLLDCNLRYPDQHKALGVAADNGGLVDFLDQPSQGIAAKIYATGVPRLRLIPAGGAREDGSEYFSSFRMQALLQHLRSRYADRYLFLDGPAAKGSPDARILSELADFVLLVAGYGRDTPAAISQAVAHFPPEKFAGVVFNQVP